MKTSLATGVASVDEARWRLLSQGLRASCARSRQGADDGDTIFDVASITKVVATASAAIGRGVSRPGQLERFIPGISTKVLNERLRKLMDYRLITRSEIAGKVPRTEYALTATGKKLNAIIESIRDLDEEHDAGTES